MKRGWFITGTDTGVGKTSVAAGLLAGLARRGDRAIGMKPVASGCQATPAGLRHDDALALLHASSIQAEYAEVNPYAFAPAVAPHLAAEAIGVEISLEKIHASFTRLCALADLVVVEGIGGWRVPLSRNTTTVDLALSLNLPVILVVGMRLGCLNHALLTAEGIRHSGLKLVGWVANHIDPAMELWQENIVALQQRIPAPLLGAIPFIKTKSTGARIDYLNLPILLET